MITQATTANQATTNTNTSTARSFPIDYATSAADIQAMTTDTIRTIHIASAAAIDAITIHMHDMLASRRHHQPAALVESILRLHQLQQTIDRAANRAANELALTRDSNTED